MEGSEYLDQVMKDQIHTLKTKEDVYRIAKVLLAGRPEWKFPADWTAKDPKGYNSNLVHLLMLEHAWTYFHGTKEQERITNWVFMHESAKDPRESILDCPGDRKLVEQWRREYS